MSYRSHRKHFTNTCVLSHLTIEQGLSLIRKAHPYSPKLLMSGFRVKYKSDVKRFAVLIRGPLKCFLCGCRATHFRIERHRNDHPFHINVYAKDRLLTWDHIIPKSLDGSDHVLNGSVACARCNENRGNEMTLPEILWAVRGSDDLFVHPPPAKASIDSLKAVIDKARM